MIQGLLLAAVLLSAVPAAAGALQGALEHTGGDAVPGGDVTLRITLSWDGRADAFAPSTPSLKVARGGTVRMGSAASTFDGEHTTWTTDASVHLPDRGERWQVGPGAVVVRERGGEPRTVELPQLVLGGPTFGRLIGQGVGSVLVIVAILGWFWRRDGQLRDEELQPVGFGPVLTGARQAVQAEPWDPAAAVEALLALRLDLQAGGVDNAAPSPEELRERLEALRYGGEELPRDECRNWLLALSAAANGGRG